MATSPFRTTPSLGPDLWQTATQFYWDTIGDPTNAGGPSPRLGTTVVGNDGAEYTLAKAGAGFAADAGVSLNQSTWVASADADTPVFEAPVAVANGAYFWARRILITA